MRKWLRRPLSSKRARKRALGSRQRAGDDPAGDVDPAPRPQGPGQIGGHRAEDIGEHLQRQPAMGFMPVEGALGHLGRAQRLGNRAIELRQDGIEIDDARPRQRALGRDMAEALTHRLPDLALPRRHRRQGDMAALARPAPSSAPRPPAGCTHPRPEPGPITPMVSSGIDRGRGAPPPSQPSSLIPRCGRGGSHRGEVVDDEKPLDPQPRFEGGLGEGPG